MRTSYVCFDLIAKAIDAVNAAPNNSAEEYAAVRYMRGVIDAIKAAGLEWDACGQDMRQIEMGHDRPMCCGVWLDKVAT